MLPIQTAQKWGWSPSAIIRGAKNPRKHHACDFALAMAYEMVEAEKCGKCGVPAYWAYSEDSSITFELEDVECYSCGFQEAAEAKKKSKPGVRTVVRAIPEDGFDSLPDRSAFVQRQMEKAAKAKDKASDTSE